MERGSTVIHKFSENICLDTVDTINGQIESCFSDSKAETIVLDMENVRQCDSSGLRFLLSLKRRAESSGKKMFLCRPSQSFREILTLTNLKHVFTVLDSIEGL